MSLHAQTVLLLGVTLIVVPSAVTFLCWAAWALFWDLYDHVLQRRTRRRNARFDARVGRDCYRDVKGLTR